MHVACTDAIYAGMLYLRLRVWHHHNQHETVYAASLSCRLSNDQSASSSSSLQPTIVLRIKDRVGSVLVTTDFRLFEKKTLKSGPDSQVFRGFLFATDLHF